MKHNQHEIPRMKALAAELKMKYRQKTVRVEKDTAEDLLPDPRYSRFVIDPKTQALRPAKAMLELCPYPWDGLWSTGTTLLCPAVRTRTGIIYLATFCKKTAGPFGAPKGLSTSGRDCSGILRR